MTTLTKGLIIKIERATQSSQAQIRRADAIDNARNRMSNLPLSIAEDSNRTNERSLESAQVASNILRNATVIHNTGSMSMDNESELSSSMIRQTISTYEMSDATSSPIIAPTPMLFSLFDIRKLRGQ